MKQELESKINKLTSKEFSVFINKLFKELGYSVEKTKEACNQGDIVIRGNGELAYIKCNHWKSQESIGKEVLEKLVGNTIRHYGGLRRGILVTNNKCSKDAYRYIELMKWYMRLDLWSIKDIVKIFNKVDENKREDILNVLEG